MRAIIGAVLSVMVGAVTLVGAAVLAATPAAAQTDQQAEDLPIAEGPSGWTPVLDELGTVEDLARYMNASVGDMDASSRALPARLRSWRGPDDEVAVVWVFETDGASSASAFVRGVAERAAPCGPIEDARAPTVCRDDELTQMSTAWRTGSTAVLIVTSPSGMTEHGDLVAAQRDLLAPDGLVSASGTNATLLLLGAVLAGLGLIGLGYWAIRQSRRGEGTPSPAADDQPQPAP